MRHVFSLLVLCGLLAGCESPSIVGGRSAATSAMPVDGSAAAAAISRYRAAHGLGAVRVDARLTAAAERQARAVAQAGYLSHEIDGSFTKRLAYAGLGPQHAAENLSAGAHSMEEVLARWQRSPGHNRNLLMPQAQRIGIARVDAPDTRFKQYWALVLSGG
jgi:uncharacterized protein YkwD